MGEGWKGVKKEHKTNHRRNEMEKLFIVSMGAFPSTEHNGVPSPPQKMVRTQFPLANCDTRHLEAWMANIQSGVKKPAVEKKAC